MNCNRSAMLAQVNNTETVWDVLVIGGGASGLGIALDAATRGYKTLLVEQYDFAKGTSSRSTKLVHGGVRYLAQGDIQLVREATIERGLLQKNAPHLVRNQIFVIPVYSWWSKIKYTLGLKFYDFISGKLSLGPSVFISAKKTKEALPDVKTKNLAGGIQYHDGQFDDSRLAINLVQTLIEQGGFAINYAKVINLLKEKEQVTGVLLLDTENDTRYTIKAKAVVNATGVFTNDILKMDNPQSGPAVVASQGIHLVIPKKFYTARHALMIPETSDGRVLFAVPWHNEVVVGTTDTPVTNISPEPVALEQEIDFILNTAADYLKQPPTRKDILSVFAGLRPLAAPKEGKAKTKEISRSHKIIVAPSNLFSIIGGKWTTYRKMGEDMVDTIEKKLNWPQKKSVTENLKIHGYTENVNFSEPLYFYGSDAAFIKDAINHTKNGWFSEPLHIHQQQIDWAVTQEMICHVEDFLARRTRALFLDARESIRICKPVAQRMATLLHKTDDWVEREVSAFTQIAHNYILK